MADQPNPLLPGNAAGLSGGNIAALLSDVARAINSLNVTMATIFPLAGLTISHAATAGGDVLPGAPSGFLTITVGSVSYKVAVYDP